ncbi:MAG: hypothetical protein GY909_09560 [Oligoflexia bacterium]|nr:hypothetical protein [Oligoflexia bacterium]
MKFKALVLGLLAATQVNAAYDCQVTLYRDTYLVDIFDGSSKDLKTCPAALKACHERVIELGFSFEETRCETSFDDVPNQDPRPRPTPRPNPRPRPIPNPDNRDVYYPMDGRDLQIGETVMESYNTRSLQTVRMKTKDKIMLSDNQWYHKSYVHKLQYSVNNIAVNEDVMEDYNTRSFGYVKAISNGLFLLSDGSWYNKSYVNKLRNELKGLYVGQEVMEDYNTRSFRTIVAISDNLFYLDDKSWYNPSYVNPLLNSMNGFTVGERE